MAALRTFKLAAISAALGIVAGISVATGIRSLNSRLMANSRPYVESLPELHGNLPQLLSISAKKLDGMDIALMNLLCAEGLPGSEDINIPSALATLDSWSKRVAGETDRYLYKFQQNPSDYQNSEAYFRILVMITVLQQDLGVHYNAARIEQPNFNDSRDLFLNGLLLNRQGTCASMPVLYVAVGRRLGYPLKLVTTKAHLFARWESLDGKERLNIEGTNQGLNCFPNDYYRAWPVPVTDEEIRSNRFLESLTPAEELAVFLSARGHCLEGSGRLPEAQVVHAQAHALAPECSQYLAFLVGAVQKEMPEWRRVRVDLGAATADHNANTKL